MNTNKLQFLHHSSPFQTVEEAKGYVFNLIEDGSLRVAVGEPFVLVYGQTEDLSALVGVGTKEDGTGVFFIDQDADVVAIRRIKAILANVVDSCGFDENGRLKPFSGEIISGSSSVEDAIEELASRIKAISLTVSDTRTVDLTLEDRQGVTGLTADVKVPGSIMIGSDILTNTLQIGDDGLYVYIDIAHTLGTNKFKMAINDQVKEIDLGDTVKSGVYDSARRSVVLTLNNNNKVYVDLQEFFNEFKASNIVCWLPGGEKSNLQSVVSSGGVISNFESGGETNIIRSVGGLFASVNLTYNALTNTLVFTKSDKDEVSKVTEIQLNSANILDHIYYDRAKEELVLIYHTTDGQRQEVRIPVSDLFEEWYTDNSNSTVTLIKDRSVPGYTSLKGNVNVAPLSLVPHNILQEFHNAGFHGLSVNGVAENIAYGDGTVKDALDAVGTDLSNEITARQNADDELRAAISEEASAREAADNDLSDAISAEANAREAADNALRVTDGELRAAITTEANARTSADNDLRAAITAETSAREAADNELSAAITAEANAREAADTEMSGRIDALSNAITAEVSARTEADDDLRAAITVETSAREAADNNLSNAISAEANARTSADTEMSGRIDALSNAITAETSAREAADNNLSDAISAEANARTSADTEMSGRINALGDAITAEVSARTEADNILRGAIDAETSARMSADTEMSGRINALSDAINNARLEVSGGNAINARVEGDTGNPLSNVVYIDSNISRDPENIIKVNNDGLFATVGLTYDKTTNTLTFDDSVHEPSLIRLLGGSLIKDIYYDSTANTLVIEYEVTTESGTTTQTVDVPVSDFFKPIEPENSLHTATVRTGTTSGGNQTISVDVKVDGDRYNMLKVTGLDTLLVDGRGIAEMSGKVDDLGAQIEAFSGLVEDKQDKLSAGSGVTLGDDGVTLRGVVSSGSEQYLTVGASGFSLSGVTDAIDLAMNDAITSAKSYADSVITGVTDIHVSAVTVVTVDNGVDSEGDVVQMNKGIYLKTVFENSSNKIYTSLSSVVTFQNSDTITFNTTSGNVVTAEIGDVNGVVDCGDYYAGEDMHGSDTVGPEYGGDGPLGPYNP